MEVLLDPSIELLGTVDLLGAGNAAGLAPRDRAYADSLERACAAFRAHPAVTLNERMHEEDPDYFKRKDLLLLRSAPPDLAFDEGLSSCRNNAERSGAWEPWLDALRDFARASRFIGVFSRASRLLAPELGALRRHVAAADYLGKIERYTRLPLIGRYRLVLSPLCPRGKGLSRVRTRDDGRLEIVSILRPDSFRLGARGFTAEGLDATVWHELCHGIMDMTVDLYGWEERDTAFSLGPDMDRNCRTWLHGMREHVVRAVMIRLIHLEKGEKAATKQFELEEFSARPHLAALLARLREYEAAPRRDYPTLAHFYPRLVDAFPRPPAAKAKEPVADGPDAWTDTLRRLAGPFYTEKQRALALERLDILLARSSDGRLILRRAVLNYLSGNQDRASRDASALLKKRSKKRTPDAAAFLRRAATPTM